VGKKLAWSMFYRNLDQPELDKIQIIKELLCVKYGLLSLPSLDVSEIDFMLVIVYFLTFTYFLCVLLVRFYIKYNATMADMMWCTGKSHSSAAHTKAQTKE